MLETSKLLILALLLNCITSLQTESNAVQKEAVEIKFGTMVDIDKNNNYFKFIYNGDNDVQVYFRFEERVGDLYLTDPNGDRHYLERQNGMYKGNLTYDGTYYLEIVCQEFLCELGSKFSIVYPRITETIDLSKNIYYKSISYYSFYEYLGMDQFKVSNLKEEKYVCFELVDTVSYYRREYYPYYPGEDPPYPPYGPYNYDFSNLTVFEVIDIKANVSTRNVRFYKFEPNTEYIINIHCLTGWGSFYYRKYMFTPISKSQLKTISGNEGKISSDGAIFGIVKSNNQKNFSLTSGSMLKDTIFYVKTEQDIENNLEILSTLEFDQDSMLMFNEGETQNTFFIAMPPSFDSGTNLYIADEVIGECKYTYTIPANTAKIIYCDEGEKKDQFAYYNYVLTYKSTDKNMRIIFSEEKEATDYIIQNYLGLMVYVERTNKESTITMKNYTTKFAYFGAENSYLFNTFYNFGKKMLNIETPVNIDNYLKLTQMNIRIGSEYIPWFEFYNIYFNQLNVKANIFIRQIYGGSELYECDASDYDIHDLQFLTTPISNAKCKNKKSVFNRLFPLDGTKILSGFITPDSYFDGYAEIKDDTKKEIDISILMDKMLGTRNNAKFLKKGVEYKINFELNHLIKLEPGFNANIQITDGQTTTSLNSQKPTVKISGEGYTIKSDKDAMVYFFGRLPQAYIAQKEINIEGSKGKIIKISNINHEKEVFYIDFGFENYCPTNIPTGRRIRENGVLYLDNLYEKMKVKLVPNEKLYIYAPPDQINRLNIEYIDKNLNNANNDYNIFLIPNNNEANSLIINTAQDDIIIADLHFCKSDTTLKLSFLGNENETEYTYTKDTLTEKEREFRLFQGDNKMTFRTNQPVVFSYSYLDYIDENLFVKNEAYWNEREVLSDLKIEEIKDKDINNIMKIKFKPNYKQSSTRYIILVAQKNSENTLDNFKDPCFVTRLLNQRPEGVTVDVIYDVGDKDSIDAEVRISSILSNTNEYIVTIISQELRFKKKINFYEPKEFRHEKEEDRDSSETSDSSETPETDPSKPSGDGNENNNTNLALAVTLPIIGVLIIVIVVLIIIFKRKGVGSNEIEQMSKLNDMTNS